jgi:NAD(P)-dependent dehydrogenase (short-subunit alcohol dehydrogenase family)
MAETGRVALITGASTLQERCAESGGQVSLHQADLSDPDVCGRLVSEVLARHGRLDYLVSNAGEVTEQRYGDVTAADWARQLAVNLSAPFFLAQAALGPMTASGFGRIVNVGSVSALMGSPVQTAYTAAKAGLITFLLDDQASYITGAVLTVDGGMSMGG